MMCRRWSSFEPCMNCRCPHNLFWVGLRLNLDKIHITDKALEVGNCCCLINEPWTVEQIANIWGITEQSVKRSEASAWRKVLRQNSRRQLRKVIVS